ncbi:MAG: hypothetical protein JW891_06460 [Candidatus Lokiarchaeota archaeon]|nr:hypothetical protein [Candidatus Lokiarchaeota archaeon]
MAKNGITVFLVILAFVAGGVLGGFLGITFFGAPPAGTPSDTPIEPYSHTIVIDGVNDFYLDRERFNTSSSASGFFGYITWDSDYLYVGLNGSDISNAGLNYYLLIYIGANSSGTTLGKTYNTQQPEIAFSATHHFWWRTGDGSSGMDAWNGTYWDETGLNFTGEWNQTGAYFESRFLLENLGTPSSIKLHVSMIYSEDFSETTWSSVPHNSLDVSGSYDPDYESYYEFDLEDIIAPNTYIPLYP